MWLVAAVLAGSALTGCSDDSAPAESAPELANRLDKVDAAIAGEDYPAARTAVESLVAAAARAQVAGKVSEDQADRILAAAQALLRQIPADGDVPSESDPIPDPSSIAPAPESEPDTDEGDAEEGKDHDDSESKDSDEPHGGDGEGEGGGNGPSSGNGPDDGHGN